MSIPTTSYEDFSTSNQGLVEDGGPWIIHSDLGGPNGPTGCGSSNESWCGGYCLLCAVSHLNTQGTFRGSFVTNISVNLANYGDATTLNFTWNYWPVYCGSQTAIGSSIPITSQVGDATFAESFPAVNYTAFWFGPANGGWRQWDNASKISHSGLTSLVRGSDPNRGYIAINMDVTMNYVAVDHDEYLNFYVKGINFLITTPIQSATAPSSSSTPSSTPSSTSSAPAGVVAGAVVGALAFVAILIIAICLFRRRRKKGKNLVDDSVIFTEQVNYEVPPPLEVPVPPPDSATRYSAQPSSSSSPHLTPFVARGSYGPPPIYDPDELPGQGSAPLAPSSPELARFAAANRDIINENLETRLQAAGYVPTEDPSRLTPDEWKNEYGVTKLELKRLQNLYERNHQAQPQ